MGSNTILARHSLSRAWRDLRTWFDENKPLGIGGLLLALFSVPFIAIARGATMADLKGALTEVIAVSVLAPVALTAFAFVWFLFRAPNKLYAAYIEELRAYRVSEGRSTEDIDPPAQRASGAFAQWFLRRVAPVLVVAALILGPVGLLGAEYIITNLESYLHKSVAQTERAVSAGEQANRSTGEAMKLLYNMRYERDRAVEVGLHICHGLRRPSESLETMRVCIRLRNVAVELERSERALDKKMTHVYAVTYPPILILPFPERPASLRKTSPQTSPAPASP